MTTRSEILRLLEERGSLTDSELTRLLGLTHQRVNQTARGLVAAGALTRVPGSDGVIRNCLQTAEPPPRRSKRRDSQSSPSSFRAWPMLGAPSAGTPVTRMDLARLGFVEHELEAVPRADVTEGGLIGWNTLGPVPDAPGLYCFIGRPDASSGLRVFYVGLTTHLWMVTKGQLPGGVARGGQRYGRPRHAGATRQRVNAEIARLVSERWTVSHWLRAIEGPSEPARLQKVLRNEEGRLITLWDLRNVGWNRG